MIHSVSGFLLLTGAQAFSSFLPSDALPQPPFTCEGHTTYYDGETVTGYTSSYAMENDGTCCEHARETEAICGFEVHGGGSTCVQYLGTGCTLAPARRRLSGTDPPDSASIKNSPAIVAKFPPGVFNSSFFMSSDEPCAVPRITDRCNALTGHINGITDRCNAYKTESASEKLACQIWSDPNVNNQAVNMGTYMTNVLLTSRLKDFNSISNIFPLFRYGALAEMIEQGCMQFDMKRDDEEYAKTETSSLTAYRDSITKSKGVDVSAKASYGVVTVNAGYQHHESTKRGEDGTSRQATGLMQYRSHIGTLSNLCLQEQLKPDGSRTMGRRFYQVSSLFKQSVLNGWKGLNGLSKDSPAFQEFVANGFWMPQAYDYAATLEYQIQMTYSAVSETSSKIASSMISAGLDVQTPSAGGGVSTSVTNKMSSVQGASSIGATHHTSKAAYGGGVQIDWIDDSGWSTKISGAFSLIRSDLDNLGSPAAVTNFVSLKSMFTGLNIHTSSAFEEVLNDAFKYVNCDHPVGETPDYYIYSGDGTLLSQQRCPHSTVCDTTTSPYTPPTGLERIPWCSRRKYICDVKTVDYPYGPAGQHNNREACDHLSSLFPDAHPYAPITAAPGSNGDFNQGDGGNSYFVFMCVQHSVQGKCSPNGAGQDRSPVTNVLQFGAFDPKSACDGFPAAEIVKNHAGVPQDFNKGAGGSWIYACVFRSAPSEATPGLWDLAIVEGATDTCTNVADNYGDTELYVSAGWSGVGVNGNWNQGASGGPSKALCLGSFTWQPGV